MNLAGSRIVALMLFLFISICLFIDPALANKFETIGGGVSGSTQIKLEYLKIIALVFGGVFLVACDIIARLVPSRSEMPLGVVTGLIGAPLFLLLLIRLRRERAYA